MRSRLGRVRGRHEDCTASKGPVSAKPGIEEGEGWAGDGLDSGAQVDLTSPKERDGWSG